ncbi:hypothetical protein [Haloferax sp. DFSO60]|uniref:DUF7266 family protein n=1 Tax=Haloferax sp. DFSO60 TaxID=3388652 RepID=UPI00397A78DA
MRKPFASDTRGVSTTLSYVLTLSITVILISGLMVASGGFVSDERERVTKTELEVVGHRLAAGIEAADRTASVSGDVSLETTVELPARVAGTTYTIELNSGTPNQLVLTSENPDVTVTVPVKTNIALAPGSATGGDVVITYDDASPQIEVSG